MTPPVIIGLIARAGRGRSFFYANRGADGVGLGFGKDFSMARIRYLLIATLLGGSATGCAFTHWSVFHCSECDDFPMPGAMSTSMMPGTYTGPPARDYYGTTEPPPAAARPAAAVPTETAPPAPAVQPTPPAPPAPNLPPGS